jgi:hypothetical protein
MGAQVGRKEVGGEIFGAKKGAEKFLGRGKGCNFGSSPKRLKRTHLELVHWWLLVHSNRLSFLFDDCQPTYHQQSLSFGHQPKTQDSPQA